MSARPAVQCSAVQCSAVQCSAVQCSAVQCSAVQCTFGLHLAGTQQNVGAWCRAGRGHTDWHRFSLIQQHICRCDVSVGLCSHTVTASLTSVCHAVPCRAAVGCRPTALRQSTARLNRGSGADTVSCTCCCMLLHVVVILQVMAFLCELCARRAVNRFRSKLPRHATQLVCYSPPAAADSKRDRRFLVCCGYS